mgnify:CR=1 FL=1
MSAQYRVGTILSSPNSESVLIKIHSLGENFGSPVRDEPHPHREAINGPRRAGSPVASSPIRCAFHRLTPEVSNDRTPILSWDKFCTKAGDFVLKGQLYINFTT